MRFLRRKNLILLFLLLMTVLVMGIGYSAINSVTGEIKGTLVANSQQGVFITNVTYVSNVDAQLGNCQIGSFLGTTMKSRVELSSTNASSSVTYRVTVYNAYATEAKFTEVVYDNDFYDNQNITFEISGFKQGDIIESKATKDITVTFKYKSSTVPSNKVLNSYLNFKMEKINRLMLARYAGNANSVYLRSSVAKNKIESIQFKKGTDIPETATNIFDASESQDNSIIGYYTDTDNNELYELTFISEDDIYTNKNSQYLFNYLTNLKTIEFDNFDTSQVTSMESMFSGCSALTTLDLSKFDTSQVTSMRSMFSSCSKLTTLDVSKFDTSKVTNMSYMFSYCYALTTLDVSKFDTSQVTNMERMFAGCSSLETIYVSEYDSTTGKGWTTSAVTNSSYMFQGCNKIVGSNGTTYDSSKTDATYARIDKTDAPGYFSEKLVYLPTGFTHVAGTTFKSGFAIQDSKGNQYVWVEVPKTAEVYPTAGLSITAFTKSEYTAIETDLHTYTNDYRKGTRYKDEYYSDATTGLTSDQYYELKNKMLKSVYQNGGFYVGKYETGIEGAPKTSFEITPTETPVIKQNAYPYNYVTCSQAQTLANSMESGSYNSSLMFGVQWDLVLKYLETKGTSQADLKTNSTSWGNYEDNLWNITNADSKYSTDYSSGWISGAYGEKEDEEEENSGILLSTGASDTFSKQGIYDLAGNVDEWTLEYTSNSSAPYVIRGGSCFLNGSVGPAAYRYNYRTTSYDNGIGFRVALY